MSFQEGAGALQPAPGKTFRVLSVILGVLMGVLFGFLLLTSLTATGELSPLALFFLPAVCGALACAARGMGDIRWKPCLRCAAAVCAVLFLLAAQTRFAIAIYGNLAYDFNNLYAAAYGLATEGNLAGQAEYFARFPNNLLLVLIFAAVMKLCLALGITNMMAVLTLGSMAAVDLSVLMACLCANRLWGRKAMRATLFFSVPLCVLHYGMAAPYSDTFSMFFLTLLLTLYVYMPRGEGPALAVTGVMGLLTAAAFKIKPQTLIIIIAIALAELFFVRLTRERALFLGKRALCFAVAAAVALAGVKAVIRAVTRDEISEQLMEEREIPFTHYLMMGSNPESNGKYIQEDYDATLQFTTRQEKIAYNLQVFGERLRGMGPTGYIGFLFNKARIGLSSIYMDMWLRMPSSRDDPLSLVLQDCFCQGGDGFQAYLQVLQALWVLILFLLVAPLACCPNSYRDKAGVVLRLEVMGFAAFQSLFEAGARYRYHQLLIFILLAAWGVTQMPEASANLRGLASALRSRVRRKPPQQ